MKNLIGSAFYRYLLVFLMVVLVLFSEFSFTQAQEGQQEEEDKENIGYDPPPNAPSIGSISPAFGVVSSTVIITVVGTKFGSQPVLQIDDGMDKGITVVSYTSRSDTLCLFLSVHFQEIIRYRYAAQQILF